MMKQQTHIEEPERLDALDELIVRELGQQARLRATMQAWDARQRKARRLRLAPVISNLLSVAAMVALGVVFQALVPQLKVAASSQETVPVIEELIEQTIDATSPQALPADSSLLGN